MEGPDRSTRSSHNASKFESRNERAPKNERRGNAQNTRDRSWLVMACLRTCATAARASIAMSSICKVISTAACNQSRRRLASRQACTALQKSSGAMQQTGSTETDRPPMQVLFCGEELPFSYTYTSEALQNDHGIKVRRSRVTLPTQSLLSFDTSGGLTGSTPLTGCQMRAIGDQETLAGGRCGCTTNVQTRCTTIAHSETAEDDHTIWCGS